MSTTTETTVSLAQARDAGERTGREPHAGIRGLMSGTADRGARLAHIQQAIVAAGLAAPVTPIIPEGGLPRLSPQRFEVLDLLAQGYSNTEVAQATYRSIETVRSHTLNIYRQFGVNSRVEAVIEAVRAGVLPSPVAAPEVAEVVEPGRRTVRCSSEGCSKRGTWASGACPAHRGEA